MMQVLRVLLEVFVVATVTIPVAALNKVCFAVLLVGTALAAVWRPERCRVRTLAPLFVLAVFCYGAARGFGRDIDVALATQLLFGVSLLLLVYPALWSGADLDGIVRRAGVWLALLSFVYWIALAMSPFSPLAFGVFEWLTEYSLGAAGQRDFLGFPLFMVHLGTSPFLLIPFALYTVRVRDHGGAWNRLALGLIFVAIVLSTSRALILISVAIAAAIVLERKPAPQRVAIAMLAAAGGLLGFAWLLTATSAFSASDVSNAIKLGHAQSFVSTRSAFGLFFGDGLAAFHFTTGLGLRVPQTEITLFDMIRYVGIILAPLTFAALLMPSLDLRQYWGNPMGRLGVMTFAAYLVLSLTNPVLFNSAGLTVVIWYWWRILDRIRVVPDGRFLA